MKQIFVSVTLLMLVAFSCDRTRTSTGWDYMPDMYYSEAYETNAPNENFSDGMNMREPVEGTVPRGMVPFQYVKTDEDRLRAGKDLKNPLEINEAIIEAGKQTFEVYCMICHGEKGDGQGFLYTSGRYPYPPASLVNEKVKDLSDGEIFHSITVGYGVMGPHGALISQGKRWQIITYIREELQN